MKKVINTFNQRSTSWMTSTAFLLLICLGLQQHSFAQTCSGDIVLDTQSDVNAFGPCSSFSGNITISPNFLGIDPITDLSPLNSLNSVTGNLNIQLVILQDLGLTNLTVVGGNLIIGAVVPPSLNGSLSSLTLVGGDFNFFALGLTSLNGGLSSLTNVTGSLNISGTELTNFDGMGSLVSVGGSLTITDNAELTNFNGLSALTSVSGMLTVSNNNKLTTLGTLNFSFEGGIITDNAMLLNVDALSGLTTMGSILDISNNPKLENIDGLSNLTSIIFSQPGDAVRIQNNASLTNIDGLMGLTTLAGLLIIDNNPSLSSVDGFINLTSFEPVYPGAPSWLQITQNAVTNLDGLANITSCHWLTITGNPFLTNCCGIFELLNGLNGKIVTGFVDIASNASGCDNAAGMPTASSNSPICEGETLNLSVDVTGQGPFTYEWSGPATIIGTTATPFVIDASSGDYSVTVTNVCGSVTSTTSVLVNQDPLATASSNSPICEGEPLNLSVDVTGQGPFTYEWSQQINELWINETTATPIVFDATSRDYTVTVTDACGSVTSTTSVFVNQAPLATVSSNSPICEGEDLNLNVDVTGIAPFTYAWSGPSTIIGTTATPIVIDASSGDYSVTVTDACGSVTSTTNVLVNTTPEIATLGDLQVNTDPGVCFATISEADVLPLVSALGNPLPQLQFDILANYPVGQSGVTITASNVCGSVNDVVNLIVYDTEPPEIHYKNIDVELVNGQASVTSADVDDGTTDNCELFSLQVSPIDLVTFDASNLGLNIVPLTAIDIYGNQSTELAVINVVNDLCLNGDDGKDSDGGGLPDDCDCSPFDDFNDRIIRKENTNIGMDFDGIDDHLSILNDPFFNPSASSSITFEAWIKPDLTKQFNTILSKGHGGGGQSTYIFNTYDFDDVGLYLGDSNGGGAWFLADSMLTPNVWVHVAASYNHVDSTISFYYNGDLVDVDPVSFTPYNLDINPTYIGTQGFDCNCNLFKGVMDEVRIWKTARTGTQIKSSLDIELKGTEKDLLAYYNFNQGLPGADNTGLTEVTDQAPYGHDASLSGFTKNGTSSNWVTENLSLAVINKNPLDLCASCPETTNTGIDFDGTNDFISIPSQPELAPSNSNSITLEAWIKPDVAAPLTILSKGVGSGSSTSYIFSVYLDKIGFFMGDGLSSSTWLTSQTSIQYGVWSHVAVSYDSATNTFSFYLNGNLDGQYPAPHGFFIDDSPVLMGRQGSVCDCNYFDGQMDEVRIWDMARSASQVQSDMNAELFGNETGLLAYFDFNKGLAGGDNSGLTIATDVSFNENNGEVYNFNKTGNASNWVATSLSIAAPKRGAIDFDGIDDFISVANDAELIPTATNAVTFEAWIHPVASSNDLGMITSSGAFPDRNHQIYYNYSNNKISVNGIDVNPLNSNSSVPLNTWTHIAAVFNMTETQLYINGELDNTRNQTLTANNLGFDITFGSQPGGTPAIWNFEGKMDDIRYWDHARTLFQIQENMFVEIPGSAPGLELCFNFNKGLPEGDNTSITLETDVTGNSHDGTLNNFARSGTTSNYVSSPFNFYDGDRDGLPDLCDYCIASKKLMLDNISLDGIYRAEEEIILGAGLTIPINGNVLFRTPELKLSDAVTLGLNKSIVVVSETCVE